MKYDLSDIDNIFSYHEAKNIPTENFLIIRDLAKRLGRNILLHGIQEQDKEIAIQKLRECVFYAIASIVIPKIGE